MLTGDLMDPPLVQSMSPVKVMLAGSLQRRAHGGEAVAAALALDSHPSSPPATGVMRAFPRCSPAATGTRSQPQCDSGCSGAGMPRGESERLSSGFSVDAKRSGSHGESLITYADSEPLSALVSISSSGASQHSQSADTVGFDGRLEQPLTLVGCVTSSASRTTIPAMSAPMENAWPGEADGKLCELASVGSALHALHRCRPCSFFGRQGGCTKRFACEFCHVPHEERIAARHRPSKAARRAYDKFIKQLESTLKPSADEPRLVDLAQVLASLGQPLPKVTQAYGRVAVPPGLLSAESSSNDRNAGIRVIMKYSF
mmetsp:Transcript_34238/g.90385  ORF Transcript_34238/g.90385 Transcript_34238/m.90385 type:complete len:315 (-) Transcript_34238:92-1036(-)